MSEPFCTHPGCGKQLSYNPRRKTTLCRSHSAAVTARSPERNAKIAAALTTMHAQQPHLAQERGRKISATLHHRFATDPAFRAMYQQRGREMGALSSAPRTYLNPEIQQRANRKSHLNRLAGIPLEYRDEYRRLGHQHIPAAERRQIIAQQIERDQQEFGRTGKLPRTGGK